tara:strand:+ start:18797 stop:20074 length:1278 start_codon:yes stop_codon:yes gene_type:complete
MSKKIAITNIVSLNPGDAAILAGMFEILREKYGDDTEIVVFDKNAEAAEALYSWARFNQAPFHRKTKPGFVKNVLQRFGYGHWILRFRYWRLQLLGFILRCGPLRFSRVFFSRTDVNVVGEYLTCDLIVSTGGTYLIENYGLWPAIYDYRLCLTLGKPLVFFTQTLGPFTQEKYKKAFHEIFTRAALIFLRDERSKRHLIDIGIPEEQIRLAKDAAFALRTPTELAKPLSSVKELKVAVSVRSLRFFDDTGRDLWQEYLESVRAMVEMLARQFKAEIVFLSTCQGIPDYWTDDAATADEVVSGLSDGALARTRIDRRFRQPTEVVDAYAGFNLVIATRMHSAILSLLAGTPVIGIAYEFKLEELFVQLGMSRLSLSIQSLNPVTAKETLGYAIDNIEILREELPVTTELARSEAYSTLVGLPNLS